MSESMIERVADAIAHEIASELGGSVPGPGWAAHEALAIDGEITPFRIARAVLTAMREPTEAMTTAAWDFDKAMTTKHQEPFSALPDEYWAAMIDAALEDK